MSVPLTVNGAIFNYPQNFDINWGIDATGWAQAVTAGMLQKAGGSFPLTADVNFGPSFGLLSQYFASRATNSSTVGNLRLASADAGIGFRNNANSGNLILTTDASDNLVWPSGFILQNANSLKLQDNGSTHTISVKAPATTATYTLTLPPDAGSNGQVMSTNGSGTAAWINAAGGGTVNSGTATQLGIYATSGTTLSGAAELTYDTSTVTMQLFPTGSSSPKLIVNCNGSGASGTSSLYLESNSRIVSISNSVAAGFNITDQFSGPTTFLSYLSGGLTIGVPTNMSAQKIFNLGVPNTTGDALAYGYGFDVGSNKITGLANGVALTDAATVGQQHMSQGPVIVTSTNVFSVSSATFTNTALTATITPIHAGSTIIITVTGVVSMTAGSSGLAALTLKRGSTNIGNATRGILQYNTALTFESNGSFVWTDTPSTTSATTYTLAANSNGTDLFTWNPNGASGGTAMMMLQEVI